MDPKSFIAQVQVSAAQCFEVVSYNNEDGVLVVQKQMRRSTVALGKKVVHVLSNEESIYGSSAIFDLSNPQLQGRECVLSNPRQYRGEHHLGSTCVAVRGVPCMVYPPSHCPLGAMGSTRNIQWSALSPTCHTVARSGDGKTAFQRCGRTLHHGTVGHRATTVSS